MAVSLDTPRTKLKNIALATVGTVGLALFILGAGSGWQPTEAVKLLDNKWWNASMGVGPCVFFGAVFSYHLFAPEKIEEIRIDETPFRRRLGLGASALALIYAILVVAYLLLKDQKADSETAVSILEAAGGVLTGLIGGTVFFRKTREEATKPLPRPTERDFTSTKLRRALTSLALTLLITGTALFILASLSRWDPLPQAKTLLEQKSWFQGTLLTATTLGGLFLGHIFLSYNDKERNRKSRILNGLIIASVALSIFFYSCYKAHLGLMIASSSLTGLALASALSHHTPKAKAIVAVPEAWPYPIYP